MAFLGRAGALLRGGEGKKLYCMLVRIRRRKIDRAVLRREGEGGEKKGPTFPGSDLRIVRSAKREGRGVNGVLSAIAEGKEGGRGSPVCVVSGE